ncbi:hypothetical protein [Streptomyces sp. NPDC088246]|uniref:hypothetical protein n=1 Tax=Streptomyces sp. NPDC088246 TaxID=3365842 RepID=UPI00382E8F22
MNAQGISTPPDLGGLPGQSEAELASRAWGSEAGEPGRFRKPLASANVAVGESEGGGSLDSGRSQSLLVGTCRDQQFDGGPRGAVECVDLTTVLVVAGRQDDGSGLTADGVELDRETAGQPVVTADHHVL